MSIRGKKSRRKQLVLLRLDDSVLIVGRDVLILCGDGHLRLLLRLVCLLGLLRLLGL